MPTHARPRPRHALVTGAAGFLGSHVVEALCRDGYQVTGVDALLDRPYPAATKRAVAGALAPLPGFRFWALDLRHAPLADVLAGVDVVVHTAALAGLESTTADPAAAWQHNAVATARLVRAATAAGVGRLVHASTSSVYGGRAVGDEHQPQRPISAYGRSKRAGEQAVLAAARRGDLDAVVVRYFSVYGPRQRADMAYARFTEALLDGDDVTIHGDGTQRRSVTEVGDAVRATLAALHHGRPGAAYNVGGGESISVLEALELIAAAAAAAVRSGARPRVRFAPGPPGDQLVTCADTTLARTELGWEPHVGAADGIAGQVAWHLAHRRERSSLPQLSARHEHSAHCDPYPGS